MRFLCLILITMMLTANSIQLTAQKNNVTIEHTEFIPEVTAEEALEPKPIFELIASGDVEGVKEVLRDSIDYYAQNKTGETALTQAIQNDDVEMVKILVKDAVINLKNGAGETPLTLSIKKGNPEIIRLVSRRAKGSLKNNFGETPLYLAVERQDMFLVEELIRKGADVNRKSNGVTPLAHAADMNNFKAAGYLIKEGATVNLPNDNGDIPLYIAIDKGYDIVAGILINKTDTPSRDVNWRTKIDETLLNIAIVKSHPEIVKILLAAGADIHDQDYFENTALHIAAGIGNIEIAHILLTHGVAVDSRNLKGETPLMLAAKNNQNAAIQFLVESGADPSLRDYQGYAVRDHFDIGHIQPKTQAAPEAVSSLSRF